MDWVNKLITDNTDAEGKLDAEKFTSAFGPELAKNFVPKAEFNAKSDALKAANQALKDAGDANGDVEKIKTALAEATAKGEAAETALATHVKGQAVKDALTAAGATDLDYLAYKLGDVEEKDIANRVKDLTTSLPDYFKAAEPEVDDDKEPKPAGQSQGYKPIDNALKDGAKVTPEQAAAATFEAALGLKS